MINVISMSMRRNLHFTHILIGFTGINMNSITTSLHQGDCNDVEKYVSVLRNRTYGVTGFYLFTDYRSLCNSVIDTFSTDIRSLRTKLYGVK